MSNWQDALNDNPLIAILRGLDADRAVETADVLVEAGFRIIEVPLNSPQPFVSIERIAAKHGSGIVVGAGTVLTPGAVTDVVNAGGEIIVSPNMNPAVGTRAAELGAKWCPGVMTPSETFAALDLGAAVLKFFPAELIPPKAVKAMRAVLPADALVAAVGGITPETMTDYHAAGADSFGLGSALFKPEYDRGELARRAGGFTKAWKNLAG
ncbi:2-dehydro-3-deoxy-6-phosphogalactonate aldolase [Marinovum algicola]|jgi:2-dehydro-3-deoxyphosphogalactonate aldolase|uniref:2-dehydro-3-deoxy-6-phosphogalactonate aldolase n=1 Tax=Marinovum algicola TaxID=42444 RepID=UPI0024BB2C08|nr:2-dehydro-3-deoxy-6-phosphogalactonate aldolase [Marinovum algicola]